MIKTLKLFGERHSGTNAVALFIVRNFRLSYKAFDLGWKHRLAPNPREYENRTESTLFAFSFRNPYSWIKSMHRHSYEEHKMAGYLKKLSFDDFLRYPFIDYENIITTWNIKNNSYINMAREVPYSIKINIENFQSNQKQIHKQINNILNKDVPFIPLKEYLNGFGIQKKDVKSSLLIPELTQDQINYINKFLDKDLLHGLGYDLL